jgi:hypothetical protein
MKRGPRAAPAAVIDCRRCRHFENAAAVLEASLPGLTSLGSAHAAVRSDDGLCAFHARYVMASGTCSAATCSAATGSAATSTRQS